MSLKDYIMGSLNTTSPLLTNSSYNPSTNTTTSTALMGNTFIPYLGGQQQMVYDQRYIQALSTEAERADAVARMAAAPKPHVDEPKGVAVAPGEDREFLDEYAAVAAELGFNPAGMVVERFKNFLAEEGIQNFDVQKVADYMDQEWGLPEQRDWTQGGPAAKWCWRPMREADRMANWNFILTRNNIVAHGLAAYTKAIPLPVLLTAKKILNAFPDAKFFVCDLVSEHEKPKNKDPFLLVIVGGKSFCVEKWDEPRFRG